MGNLQNKEEIRKHLIEFAQLVIEKQDAAWNQATWERYQNKIVRIHNALEKLNDWR